MSDYVPHHAPVMAAEVAEALLSPWPAESSPLLWDGTVGLGGHARCWLQSHPTVRVIGTDLDSAALSVARERLSPWAPRVRLLHQGYHELEALDAALNAEQLQGALLDLGFSSFQVDHPDRGFSFTSSRPFDLRFDAARGRPTGERIAEMKPEVLREVIREYGEEPNARRYAEALARLLRADPSAGAEAVASAIKAAAPGPVRYGRIHPATRTFQALRIWSNRELDNLKTCLEGIARRLCTAARLAILTYHSLEDRLVKAATRYLADPDRQPLPWDGFPLARSARFRLVNRKVIRPDEDETAANPRARSAKLRVVERIEAAAEAA